MGSDFDVFFFSSAPLQAINFRNPRKERKCLHFFHEPYTVIGFLVTNFIPSTNHQSHLSTSKSSVTSYHVFANVSQTLGYRNVPW